MVKHAARIVKGTPVRIASVATAFPSGQTPLNTRLAEVKAAVRDGSDEIDMVINAEPSSPGISNACRMKSPPSAMPAARRCSK